MQEQVKSILFISLSCVGDAVMTTPVLEALNNKYPDATIDIVSDARSEILYKHCPYRGNIILKNKKKFLRGAIDLLKEARRKQYDLIIDLRTDGLAYLCRGKKRLTKWGRKPYGSHAVEQHMGTIRNIHDSPDIPKAKVWLTKAEQDYADSLLLGLPGKKWLAFAPGNFNEKKIWPSDNYAALANNFGNLFTGVILDGSKLEKHETKAVGRKLNLPFVNLAGKTNLLQAAAVLRRASFFVGGDSGLGHIAAAMSIPTLTFFSVDRPERVLPWGGNAHWLLSSDNYARNISLEDAINKVRTIINI
ncbi:MAG: heptosyltransferase-3 [Gammaproteobacteria bacterium]|jgi:heptosyltransferase-3